MLPLSRPELFLCSLYCLDKFRHILNVIAKVIFLAQCFGQEHQPPSALLLSHFLLLKQSQTMSLNFQGPCNFP